MGERLSRSEVKRQFKQVESVAREVSELSDNDLQQLPGSKELKQEILLSRRTKAGARKRQIKFIAKLLRQEDLAEILRFLQQKKGSSLEDSRLHHEAERLRDALINEALSAFDDYRQNYKEWDLGWDSPTISSVIERYPEIDELEIRRSAHQYARNRSKTHYRELFRIIRAAVEKNRIQQRHVQPKSEDQ